MLELWHQRFGHANFKQVAKILKLEAVEGLPKFGKVKKTICGACQIGKQTKASHQKVNVIATSRCLELLHVDLMGPTRTESLGVKDTLWSLWMTSQDTHGWNSLGKNQKHVREWRFYAKGFKMKRWGGGVSIVKIRSDHGKEFENARFDSFCEKNGIKKEFSAPKTPQQNGVVERKNRVI